MPDPLTIPFKQADPNGHYRSKQLPYDQSDFLVMLGMPPVLGDVKGPGTSAANQVALFADGTGRNLAAASSSGLAKLSTGVLSTVAAPSGTVVGTSDVQTLTNKTLNGCTINGLTGLTKADVGLANVDNTSDINKPVSSAQQGALNLKEDKSNKGAVNGYAALDGSGKVPVSQLPASAAAVTSVNARTGAVVLASSDVNLGNVDNTADVAKPVSTATQTALNLKEDKSNRGIANGYATLDAAGTVPTTQLPASVVGASVYKGTWNAATNTPSITTGSAPGKQGWYYSVSVAGTTTVDGISSWVVGDQIISNGTIWQKIPNAQSVTSVNTYTGAVVLTKADVGLGNVDNTSDANKPVSTATTTALAGKESTANKGANNGYAGLDGAGKVPVAQLPAPVVASVNGQTGVVVVTKADVGLSNVDNTSDAAKNTAVATLTNKTLTTPTINGGQLNSVTFSSPVGLTKADVGLANVDNTSDSTKNAAVATLTNKTLTSPVITTPTGIVKADVGLGNVDNTSDATKNAAAVTLTNKTINGANNTLVVRLDADVVNNLPVTRLNSGTGANSASFWRGDGQWAPPAGGGDIVGPVVSADGELTAFSGTTGKIIKRPTQASGFAKHVLNGAFTTQTQIGSADIANNAVTNLHPDVTMITGQTAKATPVVSADQILIWDSAASALRKTSLSSGIWSVRQRSYNAVGNPNFEVDQRNVGGLLTHGVGSGLCVDRWGVGLTGSLRFTSQPTAGYVSPPGTSFNLSGCFWRMSLTTQQASLGASDYFYMNQICEGISLRELASDVTSVSMLVRSSVANLKFGFFLRDFNGTTVTRTMTYLCSLGTANTWTLVTLPNIPVFAAGGQWTFAPGGVGADIGFSLSAGTSLTSPANSAWQNGNYLGAAGQDNFASKTVGSTFDVGFVQWETGPECTALIDKPFADNFDECQRYYCKSYDYSAVPGAVTAIGAVSMWANTGWSGPIGGVTFPRTMAKAPPAFSVWTTTGTPNGIKNVAGTEVYGMTSASVGSTGIYLISTATVVGPTMFAFQYTAGTGF